MSYCSSLSSTRNSIYSIHSSYYSVSLSGSITSFSIILLLRTSQDPMKLSMLFLILLLIVFSALLSPRINDPTIENEFGFTRTEQFSIRFDLTLTIVLFKWMAMNYPDSDEGPSVVVYPESHYCYSTLLQLRPSIQLARYFSPFYLNLIVFEEPSPSNSYLSNGTSLKSRFFTLGRIMIFSEWLLILNCSISIVYCSSLFFSTKHTFRIECSLSFSSWISMQWTSLNLVANVASNNLITIDFSLNNPLVQFHMPLNSFSSITDRMQPVFNDFNPTHVTFYLSNKQTFSSIFLRRR